MWYHNIENRLKQRALVEAVKEKAVSSFLYYSTAVTYEDLYASRNIVKRNCDFTN